MIDTTGDGSIHKFGAMENFQKQFVLAMMAYASTRDIDPSLVCSQSGLDHVQLQEDVPVNISAHHLESLWKNVVRATDDPLFGLHFAESMQLAALGIVGQIIQTSRNVGEALTAAGDLIPLVSDMFRMRVEHLGPEVRIHLIVDQATKEAFPFTYRQMADYLMVFMIHELDGLMVRKVVPLEACFSYPLSNAAEYQRVMRCDVRSDNGLMIRLSSSYLEVTIISGNYELQSHLANIVQKMTAQRKDGNRLSSRIFNYLVTNSYLYGISLDSTAANFNMSTRTLQRKLQEEGVSFQQIADDARQSLAVSYLASGNYQVKDVAYMLGYGEQSALVRAFKRWTGKTPGEYISEARQ